MSPQDQTLTAKMQQQIHWLRTIAIEHDKGLASAVSEQLGTIASNLEALLSSVSPTQEPQIAVSTVMRIWHEWRESLQFGQFSHSDGVKFVRTMEEATNLSPAPESKKENK